MKDVTSNGPWTTPIYTTAHHWQLGQRSCCTPRHQRWTEHKGDCSSWAMPPHQAVNEGHIGSVWEETLRGGGGTDTLPSTSSEAYSVWCQVVESDQVIHSQRDDVTVCLDESCSEAGREKGEEGGRDEVSATQVWRSLHSPSPCSATVASSFTMAKRMDT